jgi:glucose/arabinose dehydrogenase
MMMSSIRLTAPGSIILLLLCALVLLPSLNAYANSYQSSSGTKFRVVPISEGLENPWGMAFMPDGSILVTERPGRLRIIRNGKLDPLAIAGLPAIAAHGQGGLLDVALHPDYARNGWIYFSYAARAGKKVGTEVGRGRLVDGRISDWQTLFRLLPKSSNSRHFGSRLVFDKNNHLFITLGDRGERFRSQDLDDHAGTVIRLHDDGRVPDDNPFLSRRDARPEIFSYGHRNAQGAILHPSGDLWLHEHGPQGGDELNIVKAGRNYGWPVITYGKEYGSGDDIGEGTQRADMEQPIHYWVPSIAPSGMTYYDADRFPAWKGNLFIGSLKFSLLVRLQLDGSRVVKEERLLKNEFGRIRDVRTGPDGYLYLLTDAADGQLLRLEPVN